jgi:epoxyqueuosine reductase
LNQELLGKLEERGYAGRIVPIHHLSDLREGIEGPHERGLVDEAVYQEYLAALRFELPASLPDVRSLIVVAVPQSAVQFTFRWGEKPAPLFVPPTYLESQHVDKQVEDVLAETLHREGHRLAPALVPKKLLAVRSGLAAYGRNNISYVDGMGSFHRLATFYSDLPCPEDTWREPSMMETCQNCSACRQKCPTGAITAERFLLHAERCITFHNEKPADAPFPAWMDPSGHNCLVGCMTCQRVCPQNKDLRSMEEEAEFSQEETALLLQGLALDQLPAETAEKLERSGLASYLDVLPRNLAALLDQN